MSAKIRQLLQLIIDNKDQTREIRAESSEMGGKLYLDGVIDPWYGISAEAVARALAQFGKDDVDIYLNSPGGDVFEGRAIQTRLRRYEGHVTVHIDGLAASAATTVALGADRRVIAEGAFFMIHNSWTLDVGDRNDFRKTADLLEQIDKAIAGDYAAATKADIAEVMAWMDTETWFSAADALEAGFVDAIAEVPQKRANQRWNLAAYRNAPKALLEPEIAKPSHRERLGKYLDLLEAIG